MAVSLRRIPVLMRLAAAGLSLGMLTAGAAAAEDSPQIRYHTRDIDGVDVFYREAGPSDAPVILLLHGFPTSSHMYRDLMPRLARHYRVIAPDYPGYGYSDAPSPESFAYTFDQLSEVVERFTQQLGLQRYALFVQDFGGPVGFRLAARHPEQVTALIVQNAVAHEEGLSEALAPARIYWAERTPKTEAPMRELLTFEATRDQYLHGAGDPSRISPDSWHHAQAGLDRPGNVQIQLALLHDYQTNLDQYPVWQRYFREYRPPVLVLWGRNDPFFTVAGAEAYRRDMPDAELHFFDAGHFALEEYAADMARLVVDFLSRQAATDSRP